MTIRTAKDLDDLSARLGRLSRDLPGLILKHTEGGAMDALALVDMRITETGTDANGAPFKPYTPAYREFKSGKGKLTQARIEKNRSEGRRATAKGKYRGFVDFTLTGQMLASTTTGFERIKPTEKSVAEGRAKVAFDGRDDLTRKKLSGNNKTRPGFLNPSKSEMDMVNRAANTNMERSIATYFQ